MLLPLACPVDHSPLTPQGGALVSAAGRRYPERAGGWDLRPEAGAADGDPLAAEQAGIYDSMAGELSDFRHPHNLTLLEQRTWVDRLELRESDRVLELGGHRSGLSAYLEDAFSASVVGLDISTEWVAVQNAAARARGSDTRWVVGDATALPFADRSFAAVVAFDVLEHVGALERAVAEAFRVLRVGGQLLVHMPTQDIAGSLDGASRWRDPADFAARQASVGHYHERMPTRQRMRILLEHVGFQVLDLQPFNVWVQAVHDHRVLPALGRLRHRFGGRAAATGGGSGGPPRVGASRFQRAYAASVIPLARALSAPDRLGAVLGVGGSAFFLARRPAEGADPLRRPAG